ncbi:flavodoxin domain-containing protein [Pseudarthrobacter scleromae]|uniref:flavodoxin domain-containing protein n=1 Tax=Pseudarthrobacter scleromae TaxID=158897 RepID=UPI00363B4567
MRILVAYATRHGATAGIAERIASRLSADGIPAEAHSVTDVDDVALYDAVVLGGAAYMAHWLKDATTFAKRHQQELQNRKVWLFSSGPLGNDAVDKNGEDVLQSARPKEFSELQTLLQPSGEEVFFGAWNPDTPPVGIGERLIRLAPASREALPAGDFRNWDAVDAWADHIAAELKSGSEPTPGSGASGPAQAG